MGLTYSSTEKWLDTTHNPHTPSDYVEVCKETDLIVVEESSLDTMRREFLSPKHLNPDHTNVLFPFVNPSRFGFGSGFDRFIPEDLKDKVCVAGGAVLTELVGVASNDVDFYPVGDDPEKTIRRLYDFWMTEGPLAGTDRHMVTRTHRSITCHPSVGDNGNVANSQTIQIILARRSTVLDVMNSFDLDSCKVAYYQGRYLMHPRAEYAIENRINVVDLAHMSNTYVHRLIKYARRGFRVLVPGYEPTTVDGFKMVNLWQSNHLQYLAELVANSWTNFSCSRRPKGKGEDRPFSGYDAEFVTLPAFNGQNFSPIGYKFVEDGTEVIRIVGYVCYRNQLWNPPMSEFQVYAEKSNLELFNPDLELIDEFPKTSVTWREFLFEPVHKPLESSDQ